MIENENNTLRDKHNTIKTWKLYTIMISLLITGAMGTINLKYQDQMLVEDGTKFRHPYF